MNINEAAEKYANKFRDSFASNYVNNKIVAAEKLNFMDIVLSDAVKEYWFAQFQSQQKQSAVWVKKLNKEKATIVLENTHGDTYTFKPKDEEFIDFLFDIDETPQKQLSDEEIEKLAEKEIKHPLRIEIRAFIKGYKAAQTPPHENL